MSRECAGYSPILIDRLMDLSGKIPTPFYALSQDKIADNYRKMMDSLSGLDKVGIYYSIKTNYETKVLESLDNLKAGFDVSVQFDLDIAKKYGFDYRKIVIDNSHDIHNGLEEAISNDVHMISVDSYNEAVRINSLAQKLNKIANLGIRIDLSLCHRDIIRRPFEICQKHFGIAYQEVIDKLVKKIKEFKNIKLKGLFTHLGLPFPVPGDYAVALKKLFYLAHRLKEYQIAINELNIGGGYPDPEEEYFNKAPFFIKKLLLIHRLQKQITSNFFTAISRCYLEQSRIFDMKPRLSLEPGKVLVNNAGIITGRIIRKYKNQIVADISINDLGFHFPFVTRKFFFANKVGQRLRDRVNIVGPTCNPYDILYRNVLVPKVEIGDILVILNAGAYCIGRSIQHARPRRPVCFIDSSGQAVLIRREENTDDVIASQLI